MSTPPLPTLSLVSDPVSLAKIQVLVVPVQLPGSHLSESVYEHWSSLIKRHTTLRGDEIRRPYSLGVPNGHTRGGGIGTENPKSRFFPPPSGTSISKTASNQHIHLTFPTNPPARHLYPLSLLRMASFPLVVIGVAVDQGSGPHGYSLKESDEDEGEMATPQISTYADPSGSVDPSKHFEDVLSSLFPQSSPFPLVRRLVLVPATIPSSRSSPNKSDPRAAARSALEAGKSGGGGPNVIRPPTEGVESWVGKAMGEVVGEVLSELGETAAALETPAGLKTLSSTLLPSLTSHITGSSVDSIYSSAESSTPILELPSRTGSASTPTGGRDTLTPGPSISRALTPGGRPVSVQPPSLPPLQTNVPASSPPVSSASSNPFRRSTVISSPFSRTSSAASTSSASSAQSASTTAPTTIQKYTSAPLAGLAGGRLMKLLGDMYLLAGMYGDAIKCFDDGAERCRAVGDVLWEGVAREGRAVAGIGEAWEGRDGSNTATPFATSPIPNEIQTHLLSALACITRAPIPYPPTFLSPSPQAISGSLSFAGPSTGGPSNIGTGEGLLAYLHVHLTLRIAHFMLIIWASGGWGSIALSCLMGHTLPRSFPVSPISSTTTTESLDPAQRRKRRRELSTLCQKSQIHRHEVYEHVDNALGTYHQAMTKTERLSLLVESVWMARWLDLPRKEATVTRALVKQLALMIVEGREESRRAGASKIAKEAEAASASVGLGLGMTVPTSRVAVRRRETTEGNESVIKLIERVISILGVDLLSFSSDSSVPHNPPPTKPYGWPELQVETIKEAIAISETLPDHPTILRLATSALHTLYPFLPSANQVGLAKISTQSLGVIRRRGIEMGQVPWWLPGKVVLSIEVASMTGNRVPREHSREEIVGEKGGAKDPFLYNPRPKVAEAGKTVIVANEQVDVFVTVHNPLAFDLEIADLSLLTSGVPLITSPLPLVISASSVQTVRVSANASQPGLLQIKGAHLRLHDGSSAEILLPVIDDKEKIKRDKRRSRVSMDVGKIKHSGIEARHSMYAEQTPKAEDEGRWLECVVIEKQPLVWIKKTSLTHGTVMLYHGESSIIRLVLENSSSTPVDLIKLSFDDSTAREAQAVIAEGELAPEHAFELDWDQINRPALTWENPTETNIPPGGRTTILVRCLGKVGCTDGSIRIDYGHVNRSESGPSNTFHTRQITFPILFTVYHTFEPHSLDLIRFEPSGASGSSVSKGTSNGSAKPRLSPVGSSLPATPRRTSFAVTVEDELKRRLEDESNDDHCLVSLSVRNVFGVPFEVALHRKDNGNDEDTITSSRLIPPGSTDKLILPIPRIRISASQLSQPIPSLTERQYVVDKSRKSPDQIKLERELFWYRDALLKTLDATWVEPGSMRTGNLSLRGQPLNLPLLDVFKKDELTLRLSCGSKEISTTDFVEIQTEVINHLERSIRLKITLEPLPTTTDSRSRHPVQGGLKNLLIDGNRSKTIPQLLPGEKEVHSVSVIFMAKGTYTFRAIAQEVGEDREGLTKFSSVLSVEVV